MNINEILLSYVGAQQEFSRERESGPAVPGQTMEHCFNE